jgi:hypothetical protein
VAHAKTRLESLQSIAAAFVEMMGMAKKPIPASRRLSGCFLRLLLLLCFFYCIYSFILYFLDVLYLAPTCRVFIYLVIKFCGEISQLGEFFL